MASQQKNNNTKTLIVTFSILAILVSTMLLINYLNRIPENDPLLIGNTAGNTNNHGLFCVSDGVVYFSNAYDSGSLYSMNPDQSNIKKLYDGDCQYINGAGDYLYFSMSSAEGGTGLGYVLKTSGLYRAKKNGNSINAITEDPSAIMVLLGNNLFYQGSTGKGIGLKKLDIIKKDSKPEALEDEYVINPACIVDGNIYYGGTQKDHNLYCLNTSSNTVNAIWEGDVWNPVYEGGYFYYMDISRKYCISRYSPSTHTVDVITHDRADTFNVGNGYIYYATSVSREPGIYRVSVNGGNSEKLMDGIFTDINITDTYTYFHEFDKPTPMYCVANGSSHVSVFSAAEAAASK